MNRAIFLVIVCFPYLIKAQESNSNSVNTKGVQWTNGLSWGQVKEKAKQEKKYIFLDCYATWCGPCKAMDKRVFSNEKVGNFLNDKFICVKVQMDKTAKDDDEVRSWYNDAANIGLQFHVDGYPTFIFFSPEGIIVDKKAGATTDVDWFIGLAKSSLMPGKVYNDPYLRYKRMVAAYRQGDIKYDQLPYMIGMAEKSGDTALRKSLMNLHVEHVSALSSRLRYTEKNISFWNSLTLNSKSELFQFIYKDRNIIDEVMKQKGYALKFIDRTIWNQIVLPFLIEQAKGSGISVTGGYFGGPGVSKMKPDYREADWKKLHYEIRQHFSKGDANRNVVAARAEWYLRHLNFVTYAKYYMIQLKKYTPDLKSEAGRINSFGWNVFLRVTDKETINSAVYWMKKGIEHRPNNADMIDTYANLLYKAGKKDVAIHWQEMAIGFDSLDVDKQLALANMKKNEPTYINEGAVWNK